MLSESGHLKNKKRVKCTILFAIIVVRAMITALKSLEIIDLLEVL